jgi:hypothetical protein
MIWLCDGTNVGHGCFHMDLQGLASFCILGRVSAVGCGNLLF